MPNYNNAVIYVIRTGGLKYVGSTCDFKRRLRNHRYCVKNPHAKGANLYKKIRENNEEWEMEIYKEFPCENSLVLELEEERIKNELNAELNQRCCRTNLTHSEYCKEKITCKLCGAIVSRVHMARHQKRAICKYNQEHNNLLENTT